MAEQIPALTEELASLSENYHEARAELGGEADADLAALLQEIEDAAHAAALNVVKASGLSLTEVDTTDRSSAPLRAAAPYQVQWDDGSWYSCIVHGGRYDFDRAAVVAQCFVLGYAIDEMATLDRVRPWQAGAPLEPGMRCHAVHPELGVFFEARVDRLTLRKTVWVTFVAAAVEKQTHELPLTHVHAGRHYRELKKSFDSLTKQEQEAAARLEAQRKREKATERKRQRDAILEQNVSDWQTAKAALPLPTRGRLRPRGR